MAKNLKLKDKKSRLEDESTIRGFLNILLVLEIDDDHEYDDLYWLCVAELNKWPKSTFTYSKYDK